MNMQVCLHMDAAEGLREGGTYLEEGGKVGRLLLVLLSDAHGRLAGLHVTSRHVDIHHHRTCVL
jgi:hypothetical protein